ncbi:MAG TPA: glycosyltransferase family 4 protein, partial [Longimicrobiaceae bacterium]|nr:glycosyltransferase family 4 protein [Longimicrobiaceae bacterium]
MHVCYLSHTSEIQGGGERSLIEMIQHVEAAGHRVMLISPPGPLRDEYRKVSESPHEQVMFRIMRRTRNPLRLVAYAASYLRSVARLRRAIRRSRPDVVHANSAPAALFGGVAVMGLGVPMVWHMRDIQPRAFTFRLTLPLIGRRCARVLAISRAVRDNLVSFGIPSDKVTIFYNAVRPPK